MAKTLVIKLAETVDNSSLPYLGELNMTVKAKTSGVTQITTNCVTKATTWAITGGDSSAHFTDSTGAQDLGRTYTLQPGNNTNIYLSNHNANIRVISRYYLGYIQFISANNIVMDIAQLKGCTKINNLSINTSTLTGQVYGDIAVLKDMTGLVILRLNGNRNLTGDIANLAGMTGLTQLQLNDTALYGDISALAGMTELTGAYIGNNNISGSTSSIAHLHPNNGGKLATLNFVGSNVTGTWPPSA